MIIQCLRHDHSLLLRHYYARRTLDVDQFEVEDQVLAGQLVVGIQNDYIVFYFYYDNGYLLALAVVHSQLHSNFGLNFRGETIDRKFYDGLRVPGTIRIFHRDLDGLLLTDGHARHSIIETFYDHTATNFKFQWCTTFGRVKCRSVAKTAMVMDLNRITCFCFLCHVLVFCFGPPARLGLQGKIYILNCAQIRRAAKIMRRVIFVVLVLAIHVGAMTQSHSGAAQFNPITTGAGQLGQYLPLLKGKHAAVFANATSMVGSTHLVDTLVKMGIAIQTIFSPEHGFRGDADAGATVGNLQDAATGIPIVSLYGSKVKPAPADLRGIDIMVYDIQDVGVRFYTYISSLQKYMEAAIENHIPLIILDRPDPNGSYVDGPVLDTAFRSFVGEEPVPVVYGMTIGEYAQMLLGEGWVKTDASNLAVPSSAVHVSTAPPSGDTPPPGATAGFRLIVIRCKGYTHHSRYMLPVKPSPNLPNMQSVYLYPSLCLFEGTGVSLGRGTSKPFQQFGAPSLPDNGYHFVPEPVPGALKPPLMGETCYGYDLSGIDVAKETGNRMSLQWLLKAYSLYPDKEHFFNGNGSGFDRLAGSSVLRQQIRDGLTEAAIRKSWEPALEHFKLIRKKYLLYAE
jgi:uncharacterized protein YbbC (DUF1343 family)